MIPIIAISNLVNGIVAAIIMAHLYLHYKKRVDSAITTNTEGIKYFIFLYGTLATMWFLYATPGLLVTDLFLIMVLQSLADIFVYISAIAGIYISFFVLNKKTVGATLIAVVSILIVIYVFGRVFSPLPHIREIVPPYIYWHPNIPPLLQIMTGAVAAFSSLMFIITFVVLGYRARLKQVVFKRSLFLAAGMAGLFLASIFFFVLANGGFVAITIASLIGIGGLLVMRKGVTFGE